MTCTPAAEWVIYPGFSFVKVLTVMARDAEGVYRPLDLSGAVLTATLYDTSNTEVASLVGVVDDPETGQVVFSLDEAETLPLTMGSWRLSMEAGTRTYFINTGAWNLPCEPSACPDLGQYETIEAPGYAAGYLEGLAADPFVPLVAESGSTLVDSAGNTLTL